MIFKAVGDTRPYPDHGYLTTRQWARSTATAHVVRWHDTLYLEDGLHRAVRAALGQRALLHARVLVMDELGPVG